MVNSKAFVCSYQAAEKFCVTLCRVAKVKLSSLKRQPGFITIDLIPHELLPGLLLSINAYKNFDRLSR